MLAKFTFYHRRNRYFWWQQEVWPYFLAYWDTATTKPIERIWQNIRPRPQQGAFRLWGLPVALAIFFLSVVPLQAQVSTVVHASLEVQPKIVSTGGKAVLEVRVHIAHGYHVQSAHPYDQFLVATTAKPVPVPGIIFGAVAYPPGKNIPASKAITALGKLSVYEGTIQINIPMHVGAAARAGPRTLQVRLTTQACDADSCFMPQTLHLRVPLIIRAAGKTVGTQPHSGTGGATIPPVPSSAIAAVNPMARSYAPIGGKSAEPVWLLVLSALLGGLILNVMPCVLPVIPLKVLSLINQAHGDRRIALRHGLVFALGIVSLFAVLGVMIGCYQWATGGAFLYGSQFQNPIFMLGIGLVLVAFALSTLGVWTIQPPSAVGRIEIQRTGYVASFSMGLLATILATPCSAPFLGSVLAWALLEPAWVVVLFFGLIGIGMGVPYVVLAAMPQWLRWVPRAGRWSDILKNILGFIILAVAVFIFSNLANREQILAAVNLSLLVAAVCWVWGQLVTPDTPVAKAWSIRGVAVVAGVLVGIWLWRWYTPAVSAGGGNQTAGYWGLADGSGVGSAGTAVRIRVNHWENFSMGQLQTALHQHHPVVVDFTASWCINCRAVKAFVLDSPPVRKAFGRAGAVLLTADLSQANPPAQALLLKLGGRAIPFLAVFSPAHPYHPQVLQDLYTTDDVLKAIGAAWVRQ